MSTYKHPIAMLVSAGAGSGVASLAIIAAPHLEMLLR